MIPATAATCGSDEEMLIVLQEIKKQLVAEANEMKPGDKVKIYQDPITKQDFEGYAILQAEYRTDDTGDGLSMWVVTFEDEPEQVYTRTIYQESK